MLKILDYDVTGWWMAIEGMRNPLNSWELSDSELCRSGEGFLDCKVSPLGECPRHYKGVEEDIFCIGQNDFKLMKKLAEAGSDHRKFMRMITVYVSLSAPLYWWKEADTYKVGTVRNSCSTMHKIHSKEFERTDFSCEHLPKGSDAYADTWNIETSKIW